MLKIQYSNPLTALYQAEYALVKVVSELFAGVSCESLTLEQLKLYYADLVKSRTCADGSEGFSYGKQRRLDEDVERMVRHCFAGESVFPGMGICRAELEIRQNDDGSHSFTFTDGLYAFTLRFRRKEGKRTLSLELSGRKSPEGEERDTEKKIPEAKAPGSAEQISAA